MFSQTRQSHNRYWKMIEATGKHLPMRFFLSVLLALSVSANAERRTNLKVVELFTSQGCSSCPPADQLLAIFREQDHLLPLSFHVDYWNYLGWEDELSTAFATTRQRNYRDAMGASYVYTPQFVVSGSDEFGLRRKQELLNSLATPATSRVDMAWTTEGLTITPQESGLQAGSIWLVSFLDTLETDIRAGENNGRNLVYYHGVKTIEQIGTWENKSLTLAIEQPETYGLAVIVSDSQGHIHGAASWTLEN